MAKLNGVKTLDMVNGEITKVAYEGAEYAKVEGEAQKDDLLLSLIAEDDYIVKGAFYLSLGVDEYGDAEFIDEDGDTLDFVLDEVVLFRKISASKPTLEQRVDALESDVAALKGEKYSSTILAVGERVKTSGISKYGYDCEGMAGVIKENDLENGCYYVKLDSGKGVYLKPTQVKKPEETIEFEGATYRKVEREARGGDVVIMTEDTASDYVKKGTPYKVTGGEGSNAEIGGDAWVYGSFGRTRETVDVYEPIEQAKYVPQEGDIVVITGNTSCHANNIGDIGEVGKEEPLADGGVKVYVPGGPSRAIRTKPCDIRKATPAEVEQYEQAVKDANKPKLKAGDFVKWTDGSHSLPNGEIFEVFEDEEGLHVVDNDGDKRWSALKNPLFKYEILSAEEAKWAKIGRKPNEFKIGDIVEVTGSCMGHSIGTIGEAVKAPPHFIGTDIGVKANGHIKSHLGQMKLVAPVESLFNNA